MTQYRYPNPEELSPDDQHRRSLYTFVKRNSPPPSMSVFDFSERHATIARRLTSNTPLQALVLLDDPQYLEAYRVLATNVLKGKTDRDEQIQLVFRLATRRFPSEAEMGRCGSITMPGGGIHGRSEKGRRTRESWRNARGRRHGCRKTGRTDERSRGGDEHSRRLFNSLARMLEKPNHGPHGFTEPCADALCEWAFGLRFGFQPMRK